MLKPVHTTRTNKFCTDCKYIVGKEFDALCNHPSTPVYIVNGQPIFPASIMRKGNSDLERMEITPCGLAGDLFEPAIVEAAQEV